MMAIKFSDNFICTKMSLGEKSCFCLDVEGRQEIMSISTADYCSVSSDYRVLIGVESKTPGLSVCGPARTVRTGPGDNWAIHRAVSEARSGEVLVVDAGCDGGHGYFGDILGLACLKKKLGGIIIDGAVRDIAALRALCFPVFALATSPVQCRKDNDGAINAPVVCGGVSINSGSLMIADDDGVLCVANPDLTEIERAVTALAGFARSTRSKIESGRTTLEIFDEQKSRADEGKIE